MLQLSDVPLSLTPDLLEAAATVVLNRASGITDASSIVMLRKRSLPEAKIASAFQIADGATLALPWMDENDLKQVGFTEADVAMVVAFIENEARLGKSTAQIIANMRAKGLAAAIAGRNPFMLERMLAEGLRQVQVKNAPGPTPAPPPAPAPSKVSGRVVAGVLVTIAAGVTGVVVYRARRRRQERYA